MTREMGTLGKDIALGVAERLNLRVVHHEIVEKHLAERLGSEESAVHRFLEGSARLLDRWKTDSKPLSHFTAEEVLELALKDNVIIRGWGATQLLHDVRHVICVRVCAPMEKRIEEMKRRLGVDHSNVVRREIERNDDAHSRTIQRQFQVDWHDPTQYDLVMNTGCMSINDCVAVLRELAKSEAYVARESSRTKLLDKLLEARINALLNERVPSQMMGSGVEVTADRGRIVLRGLLTTDKNHRGTLSIVEEIRAMEGVLSVVDETLSVPSNYGP